MILCVLCGLHSFGVGWITFALEFDVWFAMLVGFLDMGGVLLRVFSSVFA